MASEDTGLTGHPGRLVIDWPRSAGYFGGVGLAVGLGLLDPPLGLFIAAVPFVKMLNVTSAPRPLRLVSQFYEGMAKPVGGDGQGTISLAGGIPAPLRRPAAGVDRATRAPRRRARGPARKRATSRSRPSVRTAA